MRQRKTRSIPKTGVKTFENEKLSAFLHSLYEGDMLYSPLLGYMTVYDINESGVVMALPNPAENEPYDWPFLYDGRISRFPQGECMLFSRIFTEVGMCSNSSWATSWQWTSSIKMATF